ncbi:MarR family transcriptional regulator [Streptomyces sp. RFCAC02]|uniref:GbsR/MarR family transcriptional regulator n=1 Tax=Streptomyces sp. RFCAC02 TaxID=2499143 RepID=UPI0032098113
MTDHDRTPHEHDGTFPPDLAAFVERFAGDLTASGMARMPSRVFACLLASPEGALSSADLVVRLKVSPAAVSGAVRYLSQVRLIGRERAPGSRRELYRLHHDVWYEAILDRDDDLLRWGAALRAGARVAGEDTPAGHRMAESAEFMEFLVKELHGILDRWRAHRAADGTAPGLSGARSAAARPAAPSRSAPTPAPDRRRPPGS